MSEPELLPCPFCGRPLFRGRAKINPYAVCRTESCFGKKAAAVNLDNPADVAAWNRRTPASAVLPEARSADTPTSPNAREAALREALKHVRDRVVGPNDGLKGDIAKICDTALLSTSSGE